MSYLIAITGKGGVGKTTIAGLIIKILLSNKCVPVLAVDADPNTCLDQALGVKVEKTVGRLREEAGEEAKLGMATGISKQQLIEMKISESLVEAQDFDFIAMGRPEGPGCYCYANNVLRSTLQQIASSYPYAVLDNEAGLENLSRRIVQKVDLLIMVSDPSKRGFETIRRLADLAKEMKTQYNKLALIINRLRQDSLPEEIGSIAREIGADYYTGLPDDPLLAEYAENGKDLFPFPDDSVVVKRLTGMLKEMKVW
jgi:CO dehydrogenase maturation factor